MKKLFINKGMISVEGIAYWIHKRVQMTPDSIAMEGENNKYTYHELSYEINRMASFLHHKMQLKKGERVAILSQNREEYFIAYFAIAQLGLVAVPLNVRLTASELAYQMTDSGAKAILYEEEQKQLYKQLDTLVHFEIAHSFEQSYSNYVLEKDFNYYSEIDKDDAFIICYTSGTTGRPKGAVLTQDNMFWNGINNLLALDITSKDRCLVLLPLFHIGGIGLFALPTLLAGGTIIVPKRFNSEQTIKIIEDLQATILMGVPTIYDAIRKHELFNTANFSSMRVFCSGGAPCPTELIEAYHSRRLPLYQGFGMTETSPTVFMLSKEDFTRKVGSIGKPVLFCDIAVVNDEGEPVEQGQVGELIVKGPNVMKEYWGLPEKTAESIRNGWLYTGDLVRQDEEDFVYIAGRKKDMIISGGENIYPLEVEQVIGEIGQVNEVAVVGTQDEKWGEVPVAFISVKDNEKVSEAEILNYCMTKLAKYKVPKKIISIKELPKNATGKIDKKQLELQYFEKI